MAGQLPELPPGNSPERASIRGMVNDEYEHRRTHGELGQLDLALSTMSLPVVALSETVQTELHANPLLNQGSDLLLRIAQAPWDWKAMGVSIGVFAMSNAAARINRQSRFNAELTELVQQVREGAQILPYSERQYKQHRFLHRVKRGLLTAAGCTIGYKLGEKGNLTQDMVAETTLVAGAWTSMGISKFRAGRKLDSLLSDHNRKQIKR